VVAASAFESGGVLGRVLRRSSARCLRQRPAGLSDDAVFPVPLLPLNPSAPRGRARERASRRRPFARFANVCLCMMNLMYVGREADSVPYYTSTAAQRRVQTVVLDDVRAFLRGAPGASGDDALYSYLKEVDAYTADPSSVAMALGSRAGVPDRAADVCLEEALGPFDAAMAEQVRNPGAVLLPPRERPEDLPKAYTYTDRTYKDFVEAGRRAGLYRLVPQRRVFKYRGRPLISGAFAVRKDVQEDRCITAANPVNALLNMAVVKRPRFGAVNRLRAVTCSGRKVLRVCKKDARHYFHSLRLHRRWQKYLSMPPVDIQGREMYPLCTTAPMGFAPSACWAHGLTERVVHDAGLPAGQRVIEHAVALEEFPVWGCILDDVWTIEEEACDGGAPIGEDWLSKVQAEWEAHGVEVNVNTDVQGVVCGEVQGVIIDGR